MPNLFGMHVINPVGKYFNECVYVHKEFAHLLPHKINMDVVNNRAQELPADFEYDIIRYDRFGGVERDCVSFISVPDFDTADAPINAGAWYIKSPAYIKLGEKHRYTSQKKDPQVYLHKWVYVTPDYKGFNWDQAFLWSERWKGYHNYENLSTVSRWKSFLKKNKTLQS